ncbi:MAG: fumarylacetoacetate hydrolase family protein [Lysobacterales bacterium]|jgi:2-keto-4-pentenoate hydratase/2-oxohepta-3-ene-1,7-dioic acid hydratase in catechol pathway
MKSVSLDGKEFFPSKIICIGRNYVAHIRELGNEIPKEPVIFIKPNSAISADIHSGEPGEIHFEGELCIVINEGELAAVGFGLDLTKRQLQSSLKAKGLPWERSKAFDGAAVFSEFVTFDGQVNDLRLELHINDCLVQQGGCELMMYKPDEIIAEVKSFLTLEDGDLIMTGTPAGVGPVHIGDRFTGKILENEELIVEASWVVQ